MQILKLDTNGNVSRHDFPGGNGYKVLVGLAGLIGPKCELVETVRPRMLAKVAVKGNIYMLVDESGLYHDLEVNTKASILYGARVHGCPIVGNVLFVGEQMTPDGPDLAGLSDETLDALENFLRKEVR